MNDEICLSIPLFIDNEVILSERLQLLTCAFSINSYYFKNYIVSLKGQQAYLTK